MDLKLDNKEKKILLDGEEDTPDTPKYLNFRGVVLDVARMQDGGVKMEVILPPRVFPSRNDGESEEDYSKRIKPLLNEVNQYNMLLYRGLRLDDVIITQELMV